MDFDPQRRLVAHRGWPDRYPENSLEGMRAVLDAGARHVEFDVQLTADHHAVVIHDDHLKRLTGRAGRVTRLTLEQLQDFRIGSGDERQAQIPTLKDMLELVAAYPDVVAFVELKRHSISRFGRRRAVSVVMQQLIDSPCPTVFISFRALAVRLARRQGATAIGWVFRPWSLLAWCIAAWLQPDYLFIRADRIPRRARPFWPGAWRWVVYDVKDLDSARQLIVRGADLIEVDDLPGLLAGTQDSGATESAEDNRGTTS